MYHGFPRRLIQLLRCPNDASELRATNSGDAASGRIREGVLNCDVCHATYPVEDGIVQMLHVDELCEASETERTHRDRIAENNDAVWERSDWSLMEVQPTIEASEPLALANVLELGAGTGRCTVEMAGRGASIIAIDFSRQSLTALAARAKPGWDVGLVHADATRLAVRKGAFDLVASTLMSNLPSKAQRAELMRLAAHACSPFGKFVFGTHHFGVRSVLRRETRSGRYPEVPIYRYLFRSSEIKREAREYFHDVSCHPMVIAIPLLSRLGVPTVKLSRLTEHVPLVNQFGELLLVTAHRPKRVAYMQTDIVHAG